MCVVNTGHPGTERLRVAMVATDCTAARVLFHAIQQRHHVTGVVVEQPVGRMALVRGRMRRLGIVETGGQLLFLTMIAPLLARRARGRNARILRDAGLDDRPIPNERVTRVRSVNDAASIVALRTARPDVVVVAGTRVIRGEVLHAADAPFVNLHAGITPRYRGVHGGYWALVERRADDAGATVHLVDEGIDTGVVLARAPIVATDADSFATYFTLQLAAGVPELMRVLPDAVTGRAEPLPEGPGPSRLWYHPTVWGYLRHRLAGVP